MNNICLELGKSSNSVIERQNLLNLSYDKNLPSIVYMDHSAIKYSSLLRRMLRRKLIAVDLICSKNLDIDVRDKKKVIRRYVYGQELLGHLKGLHSRPTGVYTMCQITQQEHLRFRMRCTKLNPSLAKSLKSGGIDFMGSVPVFQLEQDILVAG
ncbi:hypothetical protein Tco_0717796 [Tanacetum coccineum]